MLFLATSHHVSSRFKVAVEIPREVRSLGKTRIQNHFSVGWGGVVYISLRESVYLTT